jgi:2,3-bisphosphoglycerate-dependent phosphoglycerate mutase
MHLYFIRHAQSTNNALYVETGSSAGRSPDPPLTPLGEHQAALLAEHLAAQNGSPASQWDRHGHHGYQFTHVYTSLMIRAVHTGSILAEALDAPLLAWPEIHERGGIFEEDPVSGVSRGLGGQGRAFFQTRFPRLMLPATVSEAGWWGRDRETTEEMSRRAAEVFAALVARHAGSEDRVALISHGGFYQAFMATVLGYPMRTDSLPGETARVWFTINNTGITRVDFSEDRVRLIYHNQLQHLPADKIT